MTRNPHAGTDIQSITVHPDGFAWEAIVRVRFVSYVVRYDAGRLHVELAPGVNPKRSRAGYVETVRAWSMCKVWALPRSWHRRHETMHGIRAERDAIRRIVRERLCAMQSEVGA